MTGRYSRGDRWLCDFPRLAHHYTISCSTGRSTCVSDVQPHPSPSRKHRIMDCSLRIPRYDLCALLPSSSPLLFCSAHHDLNQTPLQEVALPNAILLFNMVEAPLESLYVNMLMATLNVRMCMRATDAQDLSMLSTAPMRPRSHSFPRMPIRRQTNDSHIVYKSVVKRHKKRLSGRTNYLISYVTDALSPWPMYATSTVIA